MSKRWKAEDEAFLIDNCKTMSRNELADHFGVTVKSISDKLRRLNQSCEEKVTGYKKGKATGDHLEKFGDVRKMFIMDMVRIIDYHDIAKLVGVKHEELKEAVEKTGIKLPVERARPWADIDVGKFRSIAECARCQVQNNHGSFFVGINNCRKCLEKNIKFWIESNIKIMLSFRELR